MKIVPIDGAEIKRQVRMREDNKLLPTAKGINALMDILPGIIRDVHTLQKGRLQYQDKRDGFARAALAGMVEYDPQCGEAFPLPKSAAKAAYEVADAMMLERSKPKITKDEEAEE